MATAILANGCFWCTEAVFLDVIGVSKVESGYIGGDTINPTYREVCGGNTGHAEAVRIEYDPDVIAYDDLLDIFFATHDPTTLNRQGNDIGTQYRSAIFPQDEAQLASAKAAIARANEEHDVKVVTTIEDADNFTVAELDHQDFYNRQGSSNGYCMAIIAPKLRKFRKSFQDKLKEGVEA
ncbi:peptide-methionine (S)-S-oxide reductase MsrA [Sphingomicrobium clamense]|uniref:Peptide methionine sulfoxide reductase MsrA n=1 Tax=Sphingomicrobium clamense TaxID=2851013 RepID=A0ABS6V7M3_9SPHN|nr:peptide-methionine (S)-S-oxide reductase MsrA [Sphingomicrobium sp. B8]MBW0145340.1 peptide-methionine (S)-S-oxide reductase MsrA [Sphingomicrobium sp. B8]